MKWLNNTIIAAIFAVVLTAIVVGCLKIPFFKDKESQTRDEMMLLSYNLHAKFAPLTPDSHLVFAPIDEQSLRLLGAWPFNRSIHGSFLQVLAPEQPKAVGWDIFFTEAKADDQDATPAQTANPAPAPAANTPDAATATPTPTGSPAPPPETTQATPAPSTNAPAAAAPASSDAAPATPSASPSSNSPVPQAPSPVTPPATNVPSATPTTSTSAPNFHGFMLGDAAPTAPSSTDTTTTSSPTPNSTPSQADTNSPSSAATAPPSQPTAQTTVAPSASGPITDSTNSAPVVPSPTTASPGPAPDASNSRQAPATATASPAATPPTTDTSGAGAAQTETEDQLFLDGVSEFPNMVTAAARDLYGAPTKLHEKDLLPTRPFKNVTGDTSKLLSSQAALLPFPALRKQSYFGFADEDVEGAGGVRRTLPLVVNFHGMILPSFDFQVLLQYWDVDPDQVTINIGHTITVTHPDGSLTHIPIDEKGQVIINYRALASDFQSESYALMGKGLVDKGTDQKSPERDHLPPIKGNIVIIGVTFAGTDASPTPLSLVAPLVSTHLNLLNNILQHDFLYSVSTWIWGSLYALLIFGIANLMLRVRLLPMIAIAVLSMVLLAVGVFAALWFGNLLVPVAMPEIGLLLLTIGVPCKGFFGEEREKIRIRAAMSAYLSEKVMTQVLAHPDNVKLGGVKQIITIMFCDIRGFTKYCDNRDSAEVMAVLNDYMEEMTKVVFKYDGTVDKYIGDCIMAFWNAPQPQVDHAQRAVCCAMEMRYALANFKTRRAGKDTELFECGIGIHTGEALVGNMGSSLKRNYTAMGSTVNLGARLEALTKRLNERILISQDTLEALTGEFPITDRGEATVPGFAVPIHVYAVGADQDITSALKVGRVIAGQQEYTAEEASEPIWKPAPLPADADPNP